MKIHSVVLRTKRKRIIHHQSRLQAKSQIGVGGTGFIRLLSIQNPNTSFLSSTRRELQSIGSYQIIRLIINHHHRSIHGQGGKWGCDGALHDWRRHGRGRRQGWQGIELWWWQRSSRCASVSVISACKNVWLWRQQWKWQLKWCYQSRLLCRKQKCCGYGHRWGKISSCNGVPDRQILEVGECSNHDNGNDDGDIEKCDGYPPGRPHGIAMGPIPDRLTSNHPPNIMAK